MSKVQEQSPGRVGFVWADVDILQDTYLGMEPPEQMVALWC